MTPLHKATAFRAEAQRIDYFDIKIMQQMARGQYKHDDSKGKQSEDIVRALLPTGRCNVNAQSKSGATPLHMGGEAGQLNVVRRLLAVEACDPNLQDSKGGTALMHACKSNAEPIVRLLVDHPGIDMNARCNGGKTAVEYAATSRTTSILRILRDCGKLKFTREAFQLIQQAELVGRQRTESGALVSDEASIVITELEGCVVPTVS